MSIVIIGGHDRMHCRYREICKKFGCKCKVFTQCPSNFRRQIGSPDLLILFTNTVSHKMVLAASEQAEKTNAQIERCHCSSSAALTNILQNYCCQN